MNFEDVIKINIGKYNPGNDSNEKAIRNKGKSLNEFPDNYSILDLETTGLDPNYDDIIEVAILKVKNNEIVDKYQSLIQPNSHYIDSDTKKPIYVDSYIEELTGITSEMLQDAPKIKEILPEIIDFIGDDIIIGHNVNFDINFLYDEIESYNGNEFSNDFFDLLKISRRALKDIKHHRLKDLSAYFNYEYKAHRAMSDCLATYDILNKLKDYIIKNNIDIRLKKKKEIDLTTLKAETTEIDPDNYFYDKNICFTGKLEHFVRKDAAQICTNLGASCQNGVTKKTDILVLGNFDYNVTVKDNKSSKLKRAEELKLQGQDLEIMSEDVFIDQINY